MEYYPLGVFEFEQYYLRKFTIVHENKYFNSSQIESNRKIWDHTESLGGKDF